MRALRLVVLPCRIKLLLSPVVRFEPSISSKLLSENLEKSSEHQNCNISGLGQGLNFYGPSDRLWMKYSLQLGEPSVKWGHSIKINLALVEHTQTDHYVTVQLPKQNRSIICRVCAPRLDQFPGKM